MVDFKKLKEEKAKPAAIAPRDIFNRLPRPAGINDLYVSQDEVLQTWFARRNEQDLIIKLHTGGGKSLVGLLIAQSVMNEHRQPVLYLVPTTQLVNQILEKAAEYSISAVPYVKGEPLAAAFEDASAVMVATYESLFNGRTKFGMLNRGTPPTKCGAIILDDAHAAVVSIRSQFSMIVERKNHEEAYLDLANIFRPAFQQVGKSGTFAEIVAGVDGGILEVPFWAWQERHTQVGDYLRPRGEELGALRWPLIRDELAYCHCIFSRSAVTITPLLPSTDLIPTYDSCPRRIFMSATIADDSELIRGFGVNPNAAKAPISSVSLAGVSERMILVPELMGFGTDQTEAIMKQFATAISKKNGVLILVPSDRRAKHWDGVAEYPADTAAVLDAVGRMQAGKTNGPLVLANRYDGIDLPKEACRFLVLDGLPKVMSDYDVFRTDAIAEAAHSALVAQRVEQGMGRAARGAGDWCVVILMGRDIVAWVGKKETYRHLTASTKQQLEMGREISKAVKGGDELKETIVKAFNRNKDWVSYHAEELAAAAAPEAPAQSPLENAAAERQAFRLWKLGQFQKALVTLDKRIEALTDLFDRRPRAWLQSVAARIAGTSGDQAAAQTYQHSAYANNHALTRPLAAPPYEPMAKPGKQAKAIVDLVKSYHRRAAILAEFAEDTAALNPDASTNMFEEAMRMLGAYLGLKGHRPEKTYNVGPDVLWLTEGGVAFVIECKSGKESYNPLYKRDHAQLLEAEKWFHGAYKGWKCIRVSVLSKAIADDKASTDGTKALTLDNLSRLVTDVRLLLEALVTVDADDEGLEHFCERELSDRKLSPDLLALSYLSDFVVVE